MGNSGREYEANFALPAEQPRDKERVFVELADSVVGAGHSPDER